MENTDICPEDNDYNDSTKYIEYMDYVDTSFNKVFDGALSHGLKWIPWVGKEYTKADVKVLVVGESHYSSPEQFAYFDNRRDATQYIIWESRIPVWDSGEQGWYNRTFNGIEYTLLGTNQVANRQGLWEHLAFYNFIQRPMNTIEERPTQRDFELGWEAFIHVVKEIQPDICVFCGVSASNYFNRKMQDLNIKHQSVRVNSNYARTASVSMEDYDTKLVFIHHCGGRFYSWHKWHDYLRNEMPDAIKFLEKFTS